MWVTVTNSEAFVDEASVAERELLYDILKYKAKISIRHESRRTVTPIVEYSAYEKSRFLTGFLPRVRKAFKRRGMELHEHDLRKKPVGHFDAEFLPFTLRPYQIEALDALWKHNRGVVKMPMASGKTEVALAAMLSVPIRWVYLVPGVSLLETVKQRFSQHVQESIGRLGNGEKMLKNITVATLESAVKDYGINNLLKRAQGIVLDECQKAATENRVDIIGAHCNAFYRLAVSADPYAASNGRGLFVEGVTGPTIYEVDESVLKRDGFVCDGEVRFIKYDATPLKEEYVEFREIYEWGIVWNDDRNRMVAEVADELPKPSIVFAVGNDHVALLKDMIAAKGWTVEHVDQAVPQSERDAIARRLARNETQVVVATVIWARGINIPQVRSGFNAAGMKAEEVTKQRVGRVSRTYEGKDRYVFADLWDEHHPILERHSQHRLELYEKDGRMITWEDRTHEKQRLRAITQETGLAVTGAAGGDAVVDAVGTDEGDSADGRGGSGNAGED